MKHTEYTDYKIDTLTLLEVWSKIAYIFMRSWWALQLSIIICVRIETLMLRYLGGSVSMTKFTNGV